MFVDSCCCTSIVYSLREEDGLVKRGAGKAEARSQAIQDTQGFLADLETGRVDGLASAGSLHTVVPGR